MNEPQKFTKRPVEVEAMQFVAPNIATGDDGNQKAIKQWGAPVGRAIDWNDGDHRLWFIDGAVTANVEAGDWIVKDGAGFAHVAGADFIETYGDLADPLNDDYVSKLRKAESDAVLANDRVETLQAALDAAKAIIAELEAHPVVVVPPDAALIVPSDVEFEDTTEDGIRVTGTAKVVDGAIVVEGITADIEASAA